MFSDRLSQIPIGREIGQVKSSEIHMDGHGVTRHVDRFHARPRHSLELEAAETPATTASLLGRSMQYHLISCSANTSREEPIRSADWAKT
jgi:hypothetical protein